MFKANDTVYIDNPGENYHGEKCIIVRVIDEGASFPYLIRMKDGEYWFTAEEVLDHHPDDEQTTTLTPVPMDFDQGFGIGGLGRFVEDPIIPTIAQMKKLEQLEAQATYCRMCGESDVFDGAMFGNNGKSSRLCNDCY